MAKVQVNSIVNKNDNGAPELIYGASVPSGQTFTALGDVNIVGVVTAAAFVGDGSGLTQLSFVTNSKAIAYNKIFSYDECHRA